MKDNVNNHKFRTAFFGTPDFALPTLKALLSMRHINLVAVITQPDKPTGRSRVLTAPPVKTFAEKNNVQVFQPAKIRTDDFEKFIDNLKLDLAIVVAYGKLIPENLLLIPKYGWLNVHGSLLPKYRGASPIHSAILNGENETGVTLMMIDKGLDTGAMIAKKVIKIEGSDDFISLHDKLAKLGGETVEEFLIDYLEGKIKPTPQNDKESSTTKIIKKEDGRIDWHNDAERIFRQIKAYRIWPGSYFKYNGRSIKIHSADLERNKHSLKPGETEYSDHSLLVGCGSGILKVNSLQPEGKKIQQASEFINGNPEFKKTQLV